MFTTIAKSLQEWNMATDARQKLQHAYLASALALVLTAGIIGLINYELGQKILLVAFICIAVFLANAVAWALLQSFVLLRISKPEQPQAKSPRKK